LIPDSHPNIAVRIFANRIGALRNQTCTGSPQQTVAAVSVQAAIQVVIRAYPDIFFRINVNAGDIGFLNLRVVKRRNITVCFVQQIDAFARADPNIFFVFGKAGNFVIGEQKRIVEVGAESQDAIAIVSAQPIMGAEPHKPVAVLKNSQNGIGGQSIVQHRRFDRNRICTSVEKETTQKDGYQHVFHT
jgi:hypothetical protein